VREAVVVGARSKALRVAVLFTAGKDSTLALGIARELGHDVAYTVTLDSRNPESYMFHHPNINLAALASEAIGVPNLMRKTEGVKEDELADLEAAISGLDVEGIVTGAIASTYQKSRVESICRNLGLECLNPLWGMEPKEVLETGVGMGFDTIITSVSADGFNESWLGRHIDAECIMDLEQLNKKRGINMAFEGGEAETLVLSCPLYCGKRIVIEDSEKVWEGNSGTLVIKKAGLVFE